MSWIAARWRAISALRPVYFLKDISRSCGIAPVSDAQRCVSVGLRCGMEGCRATARTGAKQTQVGKRLGSPERETFRWQCHSECDASQSCADDQSRQIGRRCEVQRNNYGKTLPRTREEQWIPHKLCDTRLVQPSLTTIAKQPWRQQQLPITARAMAPANICNYNNNNRKHSARTNAHHD
eukprot:7540638-Alexandrium_andersonii.AAC.1